MRRPHRPPMGPLGPPGLGPIRPPRGPPLHMGPRVPVPGLGMPAMPVMGPPIPGPPVSSCTNSNDPTSMDSRLFVGNLNTIILTKEDMEGIFSPYGLIFGISMHKGYAFVQFSHPEEARRAGLSEDGKMYAGQAIGTLSFLFCRYLGLTRQFLYRTVESIFSARAACIIFFSSMGCRIFYFHWADLKQVVAV